MRVTSLRLRNFRSFVDSGRIELGAITVLTGPNNAGKSSVLRGLHTLQDGLQWFPVDMRAGTTETTIEMDLVDVTAIAPWGEAGNCEQGRLTILATRVGSPSYTIGPTLGGSYGVNMLPASEPHHFVVPYLSRRKTAAYQEDVREQFALMVGSDFSHLAAKLSRLGNPSFPAHRAYVEACQEILGFVVLAVPSANGQRPGIYLPDRSTLAIDQMGEGVPNIVGMLADLALSDGKLLLVEEPENDLHPKALKALMQLMIVSSERNQFVVSTHSHIVVHQLCAMAGSRLFHVETQDGSLPPTAAISEVEATPSARMGVLRDLGYSLSDFDLWDGWLILEESSAERIVRDYLIPFFAPGLARVRTVAAGGNSRIEPTFDDLDRLARFTHLQTAYAGSAWVRVDGDDEGHRIIASLTKRYSTWPPGRFAVWAQPQFERYYPAEFAERAEHVLAVQDKQGRREAKRELLDEVRTWLDVDHDRTVAALDVSAAEIIADLRHIEAELLRPA